MKNSLLLVMPALLVLAACTPNTQIPTTTDDDSSSSMMMDDSSSSDMMNDSSSVMMDTSSSVMDDTTDARVIEMSVEDWAFKPNAITAKKGEKVIVRLTNISGEHSFAVKDLGINVAINEGETKDIVIPTDTAGTFAFRCAIPCGAGHMDMTGSIIISE